VARLPQGNGDPSAGDLFGPDLTPNQHRLPSSLVLAGQFLRRRAEQRRTAVAERRPTRWIMPVAGLPGSAVTLVDGTDRCVFAQRIHSGDAGPEGGRTVSVFASTPDRTGQMAQRVPAAGALAQGESFTNDFKTVAPIEARISFWPRTTLPTRRPIPEWCGPRSPETFRRWETSREMLNLVMVHRCEQSHGGNESGRVDAKAMVADNDLRRVRYEG